MTYQPGSHPPDFDGIIRHFCSEGVEFVIIGGLAATLNGLIRAKRAAGRRKDLTIVPELEALRELRENGD